MTDDAVQRGKSAVMSIGGRQCHISQGWRAKAIGIRQIIAHPHAPHIARQQIKTAGTSRTECRQGKSIKFLIGE